MLRSPSALWCGGPESRPSILLISGSLRCESPLSLLRVAIESRLLRDRNPLGPPSNPSECAILTPSYPPADVRPGYSL
eukprot:6440211-Pyramimonas_sp.AAC.1